MPDVSNRTPARVMLAAMSLFIVYGSLFPFDFIATPLPLSSFLGEYNLFANRSDALDNFFLFVPFGIALQASFERARTRALGTALAVLVLAVGIQLVQLYLPSRTASISDAVWNTIGMAAGMLLATRVQALLVSQMAAQAGTRDNFLLGLIALWLCYESFPFVPTLDIGLLRAHIRPFVFAPPFELSRLLQHGAAAALAAVAVMNLGWLRRPVRGLVLLGALVAGLEVCVAYGALRRETLLGIVLGLAAGYGLARLGLKRAASLALPLALAMYFFTVLTPYRGQGLNAEFTFTPFSHLLWYSTLGELPPAAFEALAIGAILWCGLRLGRGPALAWCVLVLLLLVLLEWVRVEVAGYHGDTTSLVMALVLAPCAAALRPVMPAPPLPMPLREPLPPGARDKPAHAARSAEAPAAAAAMTRLPLLPLPLAAAVLTFGMWGLVRLPGIPYNLAKLFGEGGLAGAAMFALALLWLGAGAWAAACVVLRMEARRRPGLLWLPLLVGGSALASFVLVDLAVPEIMLNKIIGAPDLYRRIVEDNLWGEAWQLRVQTWPRGAAEVLERVVRYVALYSACLLPLAVALLGLYSHRRGMRILSAFIWMLPFWVLAKFVVFDWAITDNLDELVVDGGSFWLGCLLLLFGGNVALLAGSKGARRWSVALAATALLAGAGWLLFDAAMAEVIVNNRRVFSGVQFVLGENRTALLSQAALFGRWCLLYLGAVGVTVAGIRLALPVLPVPAPPRRVRREPVGAGSVEA